MHFLNKASLLGLVTLINIAAFPLPVFGEMTSADYFIYADSVGFNGGQYSSSTTYTLTDTAGDMLAGSATSTTYTLNGGYQATVLDENLSFTISTSSIDLGTLSSATVSSSTASLIVATNASTGYSLSLSGITGSMPTAVLDGTVTAGADEYGVSASGINAAISGDVAVTEGLVVALATSEVPQTTTTLAFKASYAAGTPGSYSQSMTLTASANF